jgi:hypothetical protein
MLWGAFSKQTAVLRIAPDRGKQHLHGLIGDGFAGVVGFDRFSAYNSLEPERRQVCWSHLRRDFAEAPHCQGPRRPRPQPRLTGSRTRALCRFR